VKSGGKTRRAAKMQSLKIWHPDILEFIECKWKEEKKAHCLIEKGGYEANFNGEAYSSILFQNANLSVRVTDEFMNACERDEKWATHWVTDPSREGPVYQARELLNRMSDCAWHCGDPGIQYDTTINRWHTCPNSGRINASNPCSEYMFLDDTACNLASVNLMKCRNEDGTLNVERAQNAFRMFFIAQEILVDHASYPTQDIARNSHLFRPLGLGYSNLGSLIMASGAAYDSEMGYGLCGAITALMHGTANATSAEMAAVVGPFEGYAINREPFLRVMQMHRNAVEEINDACPAYLKDAARKTWENVLSLGRKYGYRNAQATVLAPTGTISFLMDCDTTGIEPDIALVKYKQLAGGGMLKIVNQTVPAALKKLGYDEPQINSVIKHIAEQDTIEGAPGLKDEHLSVFDCAFKPANGIRSIAWQAHVKMMAAAQPFLSGAISKTVNMPTEVTPADIASAYSWGWQLGLKAIAIYRDGSKQSQPLNTKSENQKEKDEEKKVNKPRRERLPDTRPSITHKFNVAGHEGYICVGLFPTDKPGDQARPGELFITMAKEGSTIGGIMDAFGTAISMSLQYGVPLEALVNKFSHMRFEPMGHTTNPDIRIAKSVVDYIFRWMGITFLPGFKEANSGQLGGKSEVPSEEDAISERSPASMKDGGLMPQGVIAKPDALARAEAPARDTSKPEASARTAEAPAKAASNGNGASKRFDLDSLERAGLNLKIDGNGGPALSIRSEQFAKFQLDAPSCDNCGSITVRNGNCYLCHNCGNSMGCS
jgi:ribonucleoside-diphosphate reductase alpha chain